MKEFLDAILAFPTIAFTIPLAMALFYWVFVIVGAVDVDILGGADGAAEGLAEGLAEGAAEGAAEGITEGVTEGATEGATEGVTESAGGVLAGIINVFKLRSAPVTVVFSLWALFGWVISALGATTIGPHLGGLPAWLFSTLLFVGSFFGSFILTSGAIRPLGPIFMHHSRRGEHGLIGQTVKLTTSKVDDRVGQGEIHDGDANLLVNIRCADANTLKKGEEALIIDFDKERDIYVVEPLPAILASSSTNSPSSVPTPEDAKEPVGVSDSSD